MPYKRYIGITDFAEPKEVEKSLSVFQEQLKSDEMRLMVGVMMSYKTLKNIPCRWALAWIPKENIPSIFSDHPLVYNTIHYADYVGRTDGKDLVEVARFGGRNIQAIQLDMIWPPAKALDELKKSHPNLDIILQIGVSAFDEVGNNPKRLIEKLGVYGGIVDSVLLDKSMGKGKEINPEEMIRFIDAIKSDSKYDLGIAVAGGLGPTTLSLIEPILKRFPGISIDAQGKLRKSGNLLDSIDWELAENYLREAVRLFNLFA